MNELPGKKKKLFLDELEKRKNAGDPEATELVNKFIQEFKLAGAPLLKWSQEIDDDPLAGALMVHLMTLIESKDPWFRTIGKQLDIDNLPRMIRALPEEVRKVSLPTVAINGEPSQENLTDKWLPWMHIPEGKEGNKDKEIIELWCKGASAKQISKIVYSKKTTVHNVISKLRKNYPEAKIPKDRERKSMRF